MNIQEISNVVHRLNIKIQDTAWTQNGLELVDLFVLKCTGFWCQIEFMGIQLWDSEDDMREYISEEDDIREPLEDYLRREATEILDILAEIRL